MLKIQEQNGEIALWFSDESSFSLNPVSVYAWQKVAESVVLPAERGKVSSIIGFVRTNNDSQYYEFEGNMCSKLWIKIIDDFIDKKTNISKKTVLVIDNSSTHTASITVAKRKERFAAAMGG